MICRLCGSEDLVLAYTQGNESEYRFFRCLACRLVTYDLAGGLDQEKYAGTLADPRDDEAPINRSSARSYRYLMRHVAAPGRLLDIGCGNGRILHLAARDGWQATGLELSAELARRVRTATGCPVVVTSFLDEVAARIEGAPFDAVILRHVLEHLPDTRLALGRIRSLLAPDGVALLEFPNIDALDLRLKRWLEHRGVRRKRYRMGYVPGHCNEFCRTSFAYAAHVSGLRLEAWRTYSHRPLADRVHGLLGIGNKARALVRVADVVPQSETRSPDSMPQSTRSTSSGG